MRRADPSLTNNIKELWLTCFPNESKNYIDYFFNSIYKPEDTIIQIRDNKVVSSLSRVNAEVMINGRIIKTSTLIGGATHPNYQGKGYMKEILNTVCSHFDHSELISFATTKNPALLQQYGFRTVYRRNRYELTRDNVSRITNDGCMFDPSALDMLNVYALFVKRFNGFIVRNLQDFEKYKKGIIDQGGKIVGFYENGVLRGYASFVIDGKVLHIKECIYLDTMSLFKLLNVALQQRHIVYLNVSEFEKLDALLDSANRTVVDYKMARLNNRDLFNRLYNSNVVDVDEIFFTGKKPPYTSEMF